VISGFRREAHENCALLGLLRSKQWQFLTDVSGQPIDPSCKAQESCLTTQKNAVLIYFAAEARNHCHPSCCWQSSYCILSFFPLTLEVLFRDEEFFFLLGHKTKSLSMYQYGGGKRRWSNKCNLHIQRRGTNCLISRVLVIFGVRRISRTD